MTRTRLLLLVALSACHGSSPHGASPAYRPELRAERVGSTQRFQAVSVVNDRIVWASGTGGTWVRTTDGGDTWTVGVVPGADSLEFRDVHALDGKTAWLLSAGPGDRSRIYKTTDGGRRWLLQFTNQEPTAFFDCFAFWDEKRGVAVSDAVRGEIPIIVTGDGGGSWSRVSPERVPPALAGEGAFAASGSCLISLGDRHAWIGTGAGERARVLASTDGGKNWTAYETPIIQGTSTTGIASVAFRDLVHGVAVGGDIAARDSSRDNVARTSDGGHTWTLVSSPTFPGAIYGAFYVPKSALLVAVGPRGASVSPNDGDVWIPVDTLEYWSAGFADNGRGWMVGPAGRITRVTF